MPEQTGRLDWVEDGDVFLLASLANVTLPPTPTRFALALLAFSFTRVNREAVNIL